MLKQFDQYAFWNKYTPLFWQQSLLFSWSILCRARPKTACFDSEDMIGLRSEAVADILMGKYEKLIEQILLGSSDANVDFDELCQLLLRLGFEMRVRGSHHIFRKNGVVERINLQRDGSKAKAYQARQVRSVLLRYKLRGEING